MKAKSLVFRLQDEPSNLEPDSDFAPTPSFGRGEIEGHIYFYEQINQASAQRLIAQLHKLDDALQRDALTKPGIYSPSIYLHINSLGGDAFASLAIADRIENLRTSVYCIIEGIAASGGTIIALAGLKTLMTENSVMLIHQHSSWFGGTYEQWKDESKLQEILINRLVAFYASRSTVSEEDIREMLKHDYWMDVEEAIEKGFVDEMYVRE